MFKKIILGVPKKLLICNACFTVIWGFMNAYLTIALSKVTASNIKQQEFLRAAYLFIGYILIWEVIEFICDYSDGIGNAYIRNGNYEYYYKKLYYTKPEALQNSNTGYIAGILTQLIERKCAILFSFIISGISIIYIVYLIFYIGTFSLWFSLIVFILAIMGILIRLGCSTLIQKSLKNMTVVRGEQTRIFMDSINNTISVA